MNRARSGAPWRLAVMVFLPILWGACGKTIGETIDDATITVRVKTALLNDPAVGGLRIDVDTFKGVVTLSGRVKSAAEAQTATELARRVSGVVDVRSTLQIISDSRLSARANRFDERTTYRFHLVRSVAIA